MCVKAHLIRMKDRGDTVHNEKKSVVGLGVEG